ncbi:SRPBCC domain-containing protein [Reyranella sp. CPCC 100927]|uniref:SRPBCC family protein n=1 Tax=Reyranella sp. CPCC 100927 TaxID=2599616 RepID=UPI0011B61F21|nr:SRPBCC domain-containing protein [Reyranella sp. CPCC 100927]TWS94466.1 SRPBCC domain-containing protein [Reyranella sp. CPCC 100927]
MTDDRACDDSITVECDLDQPPAQVWRALTEPELLAAWLMPNDIRPAVGDRFVLQGEPDVGGAIDCEVLAAEPHRLLRYSWRGGEGLDSVVTFELAGTPSGGTHLRIVHNGFATMAPRGTVTMLADRARRPTTRTVMQTGLKLAA